MHATPPEPVQPLPPFATARSIREQEAVALLPPRRMRVSEAVEEFRYLNNPGNYIGPYRNADAPMMVKPMDALQSREYRGAVFVGSAQSIKTDALLLNWLTYTVCCDPADMLFVQTTEKTARDFSKRRVDRLNRDSREVGRRLGARKSDDNVFDKVYRAMMLSLAWPSVSELSGRPIPRVALTDYDRMPENVDGEGEPYDLAAARTRTFRSAGMCVAESSPGREVLDPDWRPKTPHEAPPCTGILGLYNRGDRQRWYVPCPRCERYFQGSFSDLIFDPDLDPADGVSGVEARCPHCEGRIAEREKPDMNGEGDWAKDFQTILPGGKVVGEGRVSEIASWWLKGPWSIFQDWSSMVAKYRTAQLEFERTGSEESLRTTINVDQAEPFLPAARRNKDALTATELRERAEDYPLKFVPEGARFLTAAVDVQHNRFVVQVEAWGVDRENWVVDRFDIYRSKRSDAAGEPRIVRPAVHAKDWLLIDEQVLDLDYPLADDPTCGMRVLMTVCDSGGEAGVTEKAYAFWRHLRKKRRGNRLRLIKGHPRRDAPRVHESFPDSRRKDRFAGARGEIPVLELNVNRLKDEVDADLRLEDPGPRYHHLSEHLEPEFFDELVAENREDEVWTQQSNRPNEAFDLKVYNRALMISRGGEKINWDRPPRWARPPSENSGLVKYAVTEDGEVVAKTAPARMVSGIAKRLA